MEKWQHTSALIRSRVGAPTLRCVVPWYSVKIHSGLRGSACAVSACALATALILGTAPVASASAPQGYLASGFQEVDFLQFTVSRQGYITGVLYADSVSGSAPSLYISSNHYSFTGTKTGPNITFDFSFASVPSFGSLRGSKLVLEVTASNGQLETATFTQSSVTSYNNALANMQRQVNRANAIATVEDQKIASINSAAKVVGNDLAAMQSPFGLSVNLAIVDTDLEVASTDLSVVGTDNSVLATEISDGAGHSAYCSQVSTMYSDAQTTVSEAHSMVSDAKTDVWPDLQQVQDAIYAAPGAWAAYWDARRAYPSYSPQSSITPLKTAIAEGEATISRAVAHVNADIRQANSYIARAYAMPNDAQRAMRCGPTQRVPVIAQVNWGR